MHSLTLVVVDSETLLCSVVLQQQPFACRVWLCILHFGIVGILKSVGVPKRKAHSQTPISRKPVLRDLTYTFNCTQQFP